MLQHSYKHSYKYVHALDSACDVFVHLGGRGYVQGGQSTAVVSAVEALGRGIGFFLLD